MIKQISITSENANSLLNEVNILRETSDHPNIVNYIRGFITRDDILWIVLEYMEFSLSKIIDVYSDKNIEFQESQIAYFAREVFFFF